MGNGASVRAKVREYRRDALRRKFPDAMRMIIENRIIARRMLECAPLTRMMIEAGISLTPGLGLENHDAMVALIKDNFGIVTLTDEQFEHAVRLATPPECREPMQ